MARRADGTYTSKASGHTEAEHRAERARWVPLVAAGTVRCRRGAACRVAPYALIRPDELWHLGHPDVVCPAPTAPEHAGPCNSATATWKAQAGRRQPEVHPALRALNEA